MKRFALYFLLALLLMFIWAAGVLYVTINGWFHQPIAAEQTTDSFLTATDSKLKNEFVGNFAMAIMKNGEVESEKVFSAGNPVTRNTVFQVASLSKWISAFGVMKLVERGDIELDSPVSKYLRRWHLPQGKFDNDLVTVSRLLSHTAGLTDGLGYSGFKPGLPIQSLEQSLTKASDADEGVSGIVSVGIAPGTFKYSGGGYTLLQLIVEEVTGQSFSDYMNDEILKPLGMIHSSYILKPDSSYTIAEYYDNEQLVQSNVKYTALAATSLYTSLNDLEIFFQANLNGKNDEPIGRGILKPETIKLMRQSHGQKMGIGIWGLGTILYAEASDTEFIIGHDGKGSPALNTAIRLNPINGDGIILLETGNNSLATTLASEWVFWKTGAVDTLMFPVLLQQTMLPALTGCAVIILFVIMLGFFRRSAM